MTADAPSTALIIGTFFLGLLTALFWPLTQHAITIAHEGSHALVGSMSGRKVDSVKLHANGSGVTGLLGAGRPVVSALFGYVGPSLFGILGAIGLMKGLSPDIVLWVSFGCLVVLLFQVRNFFGVFAVVLTGGLFFLVGRYGTGGGRTVFAYTWVWFLLLGGFLHTALDNLRSVGWSGDATSLREITKLPKGFFGLLWWLATLAALIYGAGLLVGAIDPPLTAA